MVFKTLYENIKISTLTDQSEGESVEIILDRAYNSSKPTTYKQNNVKTNCMLLSEG
jgi:hypothetical protein